MSQPVCECICRVRVFQSPRFLLPGFLLSCLLTCGCEEAGVPAETPIRFEAPGQALTALNPQHAALQKLGAFVVVVDGRVESVRMNGAGVTDAAVANLADMVDLVFLDLSGSRITDDAMKHLSRLSKLTTLNLGRTQLTGAGLKFIGGLRSIEYLDLADTSVTDAGLEHLQGLKRLKHLSISGPGLTDAGLKRIVDLEGLRELSLIDTAVTQAAVDALSGTRPDLKVVLQRAP